MDRQIAVVLVDGMGHRFKGYCVYNSQGELAGWMLDKEEADMATERISARSAAQEKRIAEDLAEKAEAAAEAKAAKIADAKKAKAAAAKAAKAKAAADKKAAAKEVKDAESD